MEKLSEQECEVFRSAISGMAFHGINKQLGIINAKHVFEKSRSKLLFGKKSFPESTQRPDLPFRLEEWRANPQQALDILQRHQRACDAARLAFWDIYSA